MSRCRSSGTPSVISVAMSPIWGEKCMTLHPTPNALHPGCSSLLPKVNNQSCNNNQHPDTHPLRRGQGAIKPTLHITPEEFDHKAPDGIHENLERNQFAGNLPIMLPPEKQNPENKQCIDRFIELGRVDGNMSVEISGRCSIWESHSPRQIRWLSMAAPGGKTADRPVNGQAQGQNGICGIQKWQNGHLDNSCINKWK